MGNASAVLRSERVRKYMERRNNITWNQFLIAIKDMNKMCIMLREPNGDYLCFALEGKNSFETVLWKQNIKVLCFKINSITKKVSNWKKLSFEEFMNAYNLKKSIPTTPLSESTLNAMTTSTMILNETADQDGVCVICMENPNQVLLQCLHSFCMVCVAQEMEFRPQFCCPLCKTPIEKPIEDSWEVADIPHPDEVAEYISEMSKD